MHIIKWKTLILFYTFHHHTDQVKKALIFFYKQLLKTGAHHPEPHLPYKPYETTFAGIFLFLETVGLLDWRALYAIQYNIIQYDTAQHNSTQDNTIQCTIQYAFFGI